MTKNRRIVLASLTPAMFEEPVTLKVKPLDFESAQDVVFNEDFMCSVRRRDFGELLLDLLGCEMPYTNERIVLEPGDKVVIGATAGYVPAEAQLSHEELDDIASKAKWLLVDVVAA